MAGLSDEYRRWKRQFELGLEDGLNDIADAILNEGGAIISQEAIDRGSLLESAERRNVSTFHKQAAWTAEHAAHVNYGTKPHLPPLQPILEWARRNIRAEARAPERRAEAFGERKFVVKPKKRKGTFKATDAEILRIAQAVRWKIARQGTEPVRYAERAEQRVSRRAASLVRAAILKRTGGR